MQYPIFVSAERIRLLPCKHGLWCKFTSRCTYPLWQNGSLWYIRVVMCGKGRKRFRERWQLLKTRKAADETRRAEHSRTLLLGQHCQSKKRPTKHQQSCLSTTEHGSLPAGVPHNLRNAGACARISQQSSVHTVQPSRPLQATRMGGQHTEEGFIKHLVGAHVCMRMHLLCFSSSLPADTIMSCTHASPDAELQRESLRDVSCMPVV